VIGCGWGRTKWDLRVEEVLQSWLNTPYLAFRCEKGVGVDCVRFAFPGFLDEMYGFARTKIQKFPPDGALHNPRKARGAMRAILKLYPAHRRLEDADMIEAGDIGVCRLTANSGPGHAVIASAHPMSFYHTTSRGVTTTSYHNLQHLVSIYRPTDKDQWS